MANLGVFNSVQTVLMQSNQKPEFLVVELGKQLTMVDSTKDHDIILALAQAVMFLKDVANLVKEDSKEIQDLLVMQQVQVRMLSQSTFQFSYGIVNTYQFFYFILQASRELRLSRTTLKNSQPN